MTIYNLETRIYIGTVLIKNYIDSFTDFELAKLCKEKLEKMNNSPNVTYEIKEGFLYEKKEDVSFLFD